MTTGHGTKVTVETPDEIYRQALAAGWDAADARIITAIALAESGGSTDAYNPRGPDNSYGLTQINMIGNLGPARRSEFGITSNAALFNPVTNLAAARRVWQDAGKSFGPWSTYTSGAYKGHLAAVNAAANAQNNLMDPNMRNPVSDPNVYSVATGSADAVGGAVSAATGGVTGLLSTIRTGSADAVGGAVSAATGGVTGLLSTIRSASFWIRVAFIIVGLALILIGVDKLAESGQAKQPEPSQPVAPNQKHRILGKPPEGAAEHPLPEGSTGSSEIGDMAE